MAVKEKIRIRLQSYDAQLIDAAAEKIATHNFKDSREQFESRTHKRLIDILKPSNKTVEALMSLQLPAGVDIEIKL